MDTANRNPLPDDSNTSPMNGEAETDGLQNGWPDDQEMEDAGSDTQLMESSAPDGDPEDADSSGSSGAEMSGESNKSSGGYSGDYSSISEDSSSDRGLQKKNKNHGAHRKGHAAVQRAQRDGGGGSAAKKVDASGRGHVHPHRDTDDVPQEQPAKEHIHSYHRHNHHHPPRGAKAENTEEMNRQIDEIMNLYNVSLKAAADAAIDAAKDTTDGHEKGSKGAAGLQVEANGSLKAPPQLGGLRIQDPSELRVDVQQLYQSYQRATSNLNTSSGEKSVAKLARRFSSEGPEDGAVEQAQSGCYANLMEACRPFFHDGRSTLATQVQSTSLSNPNSDGGQSSSGFTSFFTTTNSGSATTKRTTNTGSGESSIEPSHHKKQAHQGDAAVDQEAPCHPASEAAEVAINKADEDESDSSSMVVLARVKRKHKEQSRQATSSSNSDETIGSRKRSSGDTAERTPKRVRIDTVAINREKDRSQAKVSEPQCSQSPTKEGGRQQQRTESSSFTSNLTQSLDSSGSDSGQQKKKEEEGSNVEGSSNTDSTSQNKEANQANKPPVVTDISSGATTTANGSSGSGTGSGNENNTTSNKSESGSGDCANSDEQKVSGERDSTGSDGCGGGSSADPKEDTKPESQPVTLTEIEKPLIHHHSGHHEKSENGKLPPPEGGSNSDAEVANHQEDVDAMVSKEKIMQKKRKRMDMRREYEEEVQRQMRDSSESSSNHENALEPGKSVTLEEVLSFTKTARLLVQALPPFLAVHVNAGFTHLCGIQSHTAIGTPVAAIVSLPDSTTANNKESESSGSDNTNNKDGMSSLSGSVDANSQSNSNMAIANAAAMEAPPAGPPHTGLRIDRLIVARGYGHIHDVEVLCVPHHSHSHAIEGSEVKFTEGETAKRKKKQDSKILCRMSVSPVISSTPAIGHHGHTDPNDSKRRKIRPTPNELNSVKHYLIQLEAVDGPHLLISKSSTSSDTTMEAQLLGITKTEVHARRCRPDSRQEQNQAVAAQQDNNRPETEESPDDNASGMEPVATCG